MLLAELLSPLAGGDRLVAKAALNRNWRLAAPLPFPQTDYERDFPTVLMNSAPC